MFGRKSSDKPSSAASNTSKKSLSQYGLFDIPDLDSLENTNDDEDIGDADLEAELLSVLSDGKPKRPKKRNPSEAVSNVENLDKMIAESLKDIKDSDISSGDEDDPELLAELGELTTDVDVTSDVPAKPEIFHSAAQSHQHNYNYLLKERLQMYESAQQNAKMSGDQAKLRRIDRGLKTLRDLKKQVDAGNAISEDDIPPPISVGSKPNSTNNNIHSSTDQTALISPDKTTELADSTPPVPPRTYKSARSIENSDYDTTSALSPEKKVKSDDDVESILKILSERQEQYKRAAVSTNRAGNQETALLYVKFVKKFDIMIDAVKSGEPIDLSTIPPAPTDTNIICQTDEGKLGVDDLNQKEKEEDQKQQGSIQHHETVASAKSEPNADVIPSEPKTILECLEQRLAKYKEMQAAAKTANNDRKARQMGRIVDQFTDAIKLHKKGQAINTEELPTPLGYPPFPSEPAKPKPASAPVTDSTPKPPVISPSKTVTPSPTAPKRDKSGAVSRNELQTKQLMEKQRLFKAAALKAKQNGDMEQAKEYLKQSKQIQALIDASTCGLPVDMNTIPVTPKENAILEQDSNVVILNSDMPGTIEETYRKLIDDLQTQLDMCMKTRDHYRAIGDVASVNRFEQLAVRTKKDLNIVEMACSQNNPVPKFHYETKPFSIVQCNTDLTDDEVQVIIVQGISYNVPNPKEIDTYVKLTFPYPTETPQTFKTPVIYDTNNPSYDSSYNFAIKRNVRACQRIFKRQTIKCEVWSKGGFFRADSLVGTATVKLAPLETQCTIHDAFDLMGGRRAIGGKLEVKVRVRNPILTKQVENVEQKWLLIDV